MGPRLSFRLSFFSLIALSLFALVSAQSSSNSSQPASLTTSLTTSSFTSTATSRSGTQNVFSTTVIQTTFNVTVTATTTSASSTSTANSTASATPTATPITLDTKISPGFGVLGGILIVTGLPSAFWGHKNRWSSFFLIGFYTLSLVCLTLILKFGVLSAINPPNETLQGIFVLACGVAGIGGGGVAIFFWKHTKYFIGGWGGFSLGLWLQCFRDGGLIRPVGFRWILYIALGVVGFVVCTLPKIHYHVLLTSTALVGATAFILGVDCFTTAGLKEFYIWNLGFDGLFPKFQNAGIQFPVTQMMEVELGLIGAIALMGAAVQWRVLTVLQLKLKEISAEQKRRDEELEAQATARFATTAKELGAWEDEHGRKESQYSNTPLMKDQEHGTPGEEASQYTLVYGGERRGRRASGVSDFLASPPSAEDEFGRPKDRRQSIGVLPAMDLGTDIEGDLPPAFVDDKQGNRDGKPEKQLTAEEQDELRRKEELMVEIQSIRKSIEILSSEPSDSKHGSRHQSFTSRRTLSQDLATVMGGPSHLRPPRSQDPRARVQSMDVLSHISSADAGASISRPTSAPLRDEDWDTYVQERKLFQPPSGATAPIRTSPAIPQPKRASQLMTIPGAVSEALMRRQLQENAFELGELGNSTETPESSEERTPRTAAKAQTQGTKRQSNVNIPVTILPPRKGGSPTAGPQRPTATRTRTFEELNERHREKMRDLQGPLSKAEQEQAQLAAARTRWEKSKALERQAMAKRDAEKAALAGKQGSKRKPDGNGDKSDKRLSKTGEGRPGGHARSLSADQLARLAAPASSSKRQSYMKVEDWQRYQSETEAAQAQDKFSKRDSAVPFPAAPRAPGHTSHDRRRSSRMMGPSYDPPS